MNTEYIIWCVKEAKAALDHQHTQLACRYLEKILEVCWCMICHKPIVPGKEGTSTYFKGYVHDECRIKWRTRTAYVNAMKIERATPT